MLSLTYLDRSTVVVEVKTDGEWCFDVSNYSGTEWEKPIPHAGFKIIQKLGVPVICVDRHGCVSYYRLDPSTDLYEPHYTCPNIDEWNLLCKHVHYGCVRRSPYKFTLDTYDLFGLTKGGMKALPQIQEYPQL